MLNLTSQSRNRNRNRSIISKWSNSMTSCPLYPLDFIYLQRRPGSPLARLAPRIRPAGPVVWSKGGVWVGEVAVLEGPVLGCGGGWRAWGGMLLVELRVWWMGSSVRCFDFGPFPLAVETGNPIAVLVDRWVGSSTVSRRPDLGRRLCTPRA
jgi:hypothetical protein